MINYILLFIIIILIILLYFFINKKNNLIQENFEDKKLTPGEVGSIIGIVIGSLIIIGGVIYIVYRIYYSGFNIKKEYTAQNAALNALSKNEAYVDKLTAVSSAIKKIK